VVAVPPLNGGFLWRERGIQTEIKRYQLDVFHGLSNELPFGKLTVDDFDCQDFSNSR
jgi:hypothetical protein